MRKLLYIFEAQSKHESAAAILLDDVILHSMCEVACFATGVSSCDSNPIRAHFEQLVTFYGITSSNQTMQESESHFKMDCLDGLIDMPAIIDDFQPDIIICMQSTRMTNRLWMRLVELHWKGKFIPYVALDCILSDIQQIPFMQVCDTCIACSQFTYDQLSSIKRNVRAFNLPLPMHAPNTQGWNKTEIRRRLLKQVPNVENAFLLMNASSQQASKRIDITIEAFALWMKKRAAADAFLILKCKPCRHAPTSALSVMLERAEQKHGVIIRNKTIIIDTRLPQGIVSALYFISDAVVNTSSGEGVCSVACESALMSVPQVLPRSSSFVDVFDAESAIFYECSKQSFVSGRLLNDNFTPDHVMCVWQSTPRACIGWVSPHAFTDHLHCYQCTDIVNVLVSGDGASTCETGLMCTDANVCNVVVKYHVSNISLVRKVLKMEKNIRIRKRVQVLMRLRDLQAFAKELKVSVPFLNQSSFANDDTSSHVKEMHHTCMQTIVDSMNVNVLVPDVHAVVDAIDTLHTEKERAKQLAEAAALNVLNRCDPVQARRTFRTMINALQ